MWSTCLQVPFRGSFVLSMRSRRGFGGCSVALYPLAPGMLAGVYLLLFRPLWIRCPDATSVTRGSRFGSADPLYPPCSNAIGSTLTDCSDCFSYTMHAAVWPDKRRCR
jgi:hypothetical protein